MIKDKKNDLFIIYSFVIIATIISFLFRVNYLVSIITFTIPPISFLLYRLRKDDKRFILESILWAIPASIIIDLLGHLNKAWEESTLFESRFLGLMPYEGLLWGFFYVLLIILFYEYFFDRSKIHRFLKRSYYFFSLIILLAFITIILALNYRSLLEVQYFYAIIIVLFSLLNILILKKFKTLRLKSLLATFFLMPFYFMWEVIALELGLWTFEKGNHVLYLNFPSGYSIPLEEVAWFTVVTMAVILIHELFMDNRK